MRLAAGFRLEELKPVSNLPTMRLQDAYRALGIIKEESDTPTQRIALPQTTLSDVEEMSASTASIVPSPVQRVTSQHVRLGIQIEEDLRVEPVIVVDPPQHTCPKCGHQFSDTQQRIATNNW